MKRFAFYRCMVVSEEKCIALKTQGYAEGGIGLVKESLGWVATHIPTGAKITPFSSQHTTARQALVEAETILAETEDILRIIQRVKSHAGYPAFLEDREKQILGDEGG